MHFNIVEMFLITEVFKLNNRMVGPLSMLLQKNMDECCTLAEEHEIKNE